MTTTTMGRKRNGEGRRVQLVQIAAKIFAEEGYTETSMERISKQAGMTGPALYRHFASKQDILDTICVEALEQALKNALRIQAEENRNAQEALRKLLRSRLEHVFGPGGSSDFLVARQKAHLSKPALERISAIQEKIRAICESWLREIKPESSPPNIEIALFAAWNMITYTVWRSKDRSLLPADDLKELLEQVAWSTLLA